MHIYTTEQQQQKGLSGKGRRPPTIQQKAGQARHNIRVKADSTAQDSAGQRRTATHRRSTAPHSRPDREAATTGDSTTGEAPGGARHVQHRESASLRPTGVPASALLAKPGERRTAGVPPRLQPTEHAPKAPSGCPSSDDQHRHRRNTNQTATQRQHNTAQHRLQFRLSAQYQHHRLSTKRRPLNPYHRRPRAPLIATNTGCPPDDRARHPQSLHASQPSIGTDCPSPRSAWRCCRWYLHKPGRRDGYRRREYSSHTRYRQIYRVHARAANERSSRPTGARDRAGM